MYCPECGTVHWPDGVPPPFWCFPVLPTFFSRETAGLTGWRNNRKVQCVRWSLSRWQKSWRAEPRWWGTHSGAVHLRTVATQKRSASGVKVAPARTAEWRLAHSGYSICWVWFPTVRGSILCSHFPASTGPWCSTTGGYWQRWAALLRMWYRKSAARQMWCRGYSRWSTHGDVTSSGIRTFTCRQRPAAWHQTTPGKTFIFTPVRWWACGVTG